MCNNPNGKNEFLPFDSNDSPADFDVKHFQLSIHLSGGIFQSKFIFNQFSASIRICVFLIQKLFQFFSFRYRLIAVVQVQAIAVCLG